MKNELIVLNRAKDLIKYIDVYVLSSFPKSKVGLKIKLEEEIYSLLKHIISANYNERNLRQKSIKDALISVSYIDILIGYSFEYEFIIKKRFLSIVNKLSEIRKMLIGWNNDEKSKIF